MRQTLGAEIKKLKQKTIELEMPGPNQQGVLGNSTSIGLDIEPRKITGIKSLADSHPTPSDRIRFYSLLSYFLEIRTKLMTCNTELSI